MSISPGRSAARKRCSAALGHLVWRSGRRRRRCPFPRHELVDAGLRPALALLIVHLAAQGTLGAAIESVIFFTLKHYAGVHGMHYGAGPRMQNVVLTLVYPYAALFAVLRVAQNWRGAARDRVLHLCAAFTMAGYLGFLVRPDVPHIAVAVPLALPLLFHASRGLEFPTFRRLRPALLALAALVMLVPAWVLLRDAREALRTTPLETPRGSVVLVRREAGGEAAIRRILALPAGDTVFVYPYSPVLPFLTARTHPARIDIFVPSYTSAAQWWEACLSVLARAQWVVRDVTWTDEFLLRAFPALRDPNPAERRRFERILADSFEPVARDGAFELSRRTPSARPERCAADGD